METLQVYINALVSMVTAVNTQKSIDMKNERRKDNLVSKKERNKVEKKLD